MIANYLKVFVRLFFKRTAFTLVNIIGLAAGLACCLIIALFVRHELSFDRFFANSDQFYRATTVSVDPAGVRSEGAATFFPVAPLLADNFTAITDIARVRIRPSLLSAGDTAFHESQFQLVDPAFFRMFDFTWLEGDPMSALTGAADVVLTRSIATKYFGNESPLGQSLLMSEGVVLRVTGVIEDLPSNTHLSGALFATMALREVLDPVAATRPWFGESYHTYVLLRPGVNIEQLRSEVDAFGTANIPSNFNVLFTLQLDAVTDIHMNPAIGDMKSPGSKLNLAVFTAIGFGILLVACANFVNLSTARSIQRFGEVGLRLTLGARRAQLIVQFLGESVLFALLAVLLALLVVELMLPGIQSFLELDLAFDSLFNPALLVILLGTTLVLGVAAGWYPALLMSRFRPALALKKQPASLARGVALKNILVVLQFSVAIFMIIASMVIWLQMRFAGALELGYVRDQVVIIRTSDTGSFSRVDLLKERLLQGGDITAAAVSESTPEQLRGAVFVNAEGEETQHRLAHISVDPDYFSLYDLPLLAGRLLRNDGGQDLIRAASADASQPSGSFVLNETGARQFGWSPEQAIGKLIVRRGGKFTVVGVVGDTLESAHAEVTPSLYATPEGASAGHLLSVRLRGNPAAALDFIDRTWSEVNPAEPVVRSFIDDNIEARYRSDDRLMHLSFLFSAMAILISCMGLFGLASFNAQKRVKEVGVRKVMGASVWNIVLLLTSDFSRLVLLSNLIAWPVAYFAMERWLQNFAYRIDLTPLIFIGSGLIALCIAWVTVGSTAAKAASQKPVLALRYE